MSSTFASSTTCVGLVGVSGFGATLPKIARRAFKRSGKPRVPKPQPTCSGANAGQATNSVATLATIAAPVGVTSSASSPASIVGTERRQATVAGAGNGNTPCWQSTLPRPMGSGEETTVAPRKSKQAAAPTMSTMASTAPTS